MFPERWMGAPGLEERQGSPRPPPRAPLLPPWPWGRGDTAKGKEGTLRLRLGLQVLPLVFCLNGAAGPSTACNLQPVASQSPPTNKRAQPAPPALPGAVLCRAG